MMVVTVPVYHQAGLGVHAAARRGHAVLHALHHAGHLDRGGRGRSLQVTDRIMKQFPEVDRVLGKAGRAETSTDPAPLSMLETVITLKPRGAVAQAFRRGIPGGRRNG